MKTSTIVIGGVAIGLGFVLFQRMRAGAVAPSAGIPEIVPTATGTRAEQIAGGLGQFFNGFAGLYDAFNPPPKPKGSTASASAAARHLGIPKPSGATSTFAAGTARPYTLPNSPRRIIPASPGGSFAMLPEQKILLGLA